MKNDQQSIPEIGYWRDDKTSPLAVARRRAIGALVGNCFCCVLFTFVWGLLSDWIEWPWLAVQCFVAVFMPPIMTVMVLRIKRIDVSYDFSSSSLMFYRNIYRIQGFIFIQYISAKIFMTHAYGRHFGIFLLLEPMVWIGGGLYLLSFWWAARQIVYDGIVLSQNMPKYWILLRLALLGILYCAYMFLVINFSWLPGGYVR